MTDLDTTGGTTSGSRGIGALVGALGLVAALTVGALALDSGTPAAASGLEQFDSCAELEAWTEDLQTQDGAEDTPSIAVEEGRAESGAAGAASGAPAAADAATSSAGGDEAQASESLAADGAAAGGGTGGTNTVVEGIDEIDVIDRVADDRLLVSRNGVLALVDLVSLEVVAQVGGVPYDARISAADGVVFVAGTTYDDSGRTSTDVRRIRIDGDGLVEDGGWSTPGYLLDARRTGDRLHVVVVDQPYEVGVVPFEGGPVPCDEVWRPVAPATTPAATLVATLPADGGLAPTAIAEITGAGGNLLVTGGAVYVVTETYGTEDGSVTSGIHRFDLGTLTPTGSGAVPGTVAGPFALSEHEGNLRVATSRSGGFGGRPIPIEGDIAVDPAVSGPAIDVAEAAPAQAPTEEEPAEGTTTTVAASDPTEPTEPTEPTVTLPVEETTTTVPETTTTVPETTTTEAPTTTAPADESALAEVFVLDTDGDLDVVGATGRFGREFETIHGVRFVGDVAYVVTFLQTDPFWVIDLADPSRPAVVGELQIPGFSGYLHPVGDDRVVGFGPDGQGQVAARLFDVSDPSAPAVIDEITLGDDSPVAYDHHAFVALAEGRFAVPFSEFPEYVGGGDCFVEPLPAVDPIPVEEPGATSGAGDAGIAIVEPVPDCVQPEPVGGASGAVVLEVVDGRLEEVERPAVDRPDLFAERVVQAPDGTWILLSYDRLAATEGGRELVLPTA